MARELQEASSCHGQFLWVASRSGNQERKVKKRDGGWGALRQSMFYGLMESS